MRGRKRLSRSETGRAGESEALAYLSGRGMRLLARNWRYGHRELDLVMEEGERTRFIEVRSRGKTGPVEPFETVGPVKRRHVLAAARRFMQVNKRRGEAVFDVVSVVFSPEGGFRLDYFPDAFGPEW